MEFLKETQKTILLYHAISGLVGLKWTEKKKTGLDLAIQGLAYFLWKTATAFLLVLPNIWADRKILPVLT